MAVATGTAATGTVTIGGVVCYSTQEIMKMFLFNHQSQVSNLIKRHKLPYVKLGKSNYFRKETVDKWFKNLEKTVVTK